jgi:hypothetical protein
MEQVFLEKLTVAYLVSKLAALCHLTWSLWIQSNPVYTILRCNLMLTSHLTLDLSSGLFPFAFPLKFCTYYLSHTCNAPSPSHPPWFNDRNNIWRRKNRHHQYNHHHDHIIIITFIAITLFTVVIIIVITVIILFSFSQKRTESRVRYHNCLLTL